MILSAVAPFSAALVTNPARKHGLPAEFAVFKGRLEVTRPGAKEFRVDRGSTLEKYLLEVAREKQAIGDRKLELIRGK